MIIARPLRDLQGDAGRITAESRGARARTLAYRSHSSLNEIITRTPGTSTGTPF
jgi:hypothetical protein